jgi:hypothetical protein
VLNCSRGNSDQYRSRRQARVLSQGRAKRAEDLETTKKNVGKPVIEVGFIIFLFYSNPLIENLSAQVWGRKTGWLGRSQMFFTSAIFEIAAITALVSYVVFEFVRKRHASIRT